MSAEQDSMLGHEVCRAGQHAAGQDSWDLKSSGQDSMLETEVCRTEWHVTGQDDMLGPEGCWVGQHDGTQMEFLGSSHPKEQQTHCPLLVLFKPLIFLLFFQFLLMCTCVSIY